MTSERKTVPPLAGSSPGERWKATSPKRLFYKIGEVCEIADIPPHVLRYWETEFPSLKPIKNSAGQRVYRPREIELVLTIRRLLYDEGYTIHGARKKIREGRAAEPAPPPPVAAAPSPPPPAPSPVAPAAAGLTLFPDLGLLGEIRTELQVLLEILEKKSK